MGGLKTKRGLILTGLMLIAGVIYAGVSLPSLNYANPDASNSLQGRITVRSLYRGRIRRASPLITTVVIDSELESQKLSSPVIVSKNTPQDILHHPRVLEWCRTPDSSFTGREGTPIRGFKLSSVLLLTTSGHTVHNQLQNSCQLWQFLAKFKDDRLSSYKEMISIHQNVVKEKGPFKVYDSAPFSGKCNQGELSPLGVSQHIKLGEFIRKSYFTKLKTLRILPRDTIPMASSIKDQAAYQSTMAFLHGLLSEKQFVKAGISKIQDNLCHDNNDLSCRCDALLGHKDFIGDSYAKILKYPSKSNEINLQSKQTSRDQIAKILKILNGVADICQTNGNICANGECGDLKSIDKVFHMIDNSISNITRSVDFIENARLYSHPFLLNAVNILLEPKQDFTLYTVRDFLFVNVLVSLGIPVRTLPPPASRLAIEVHERPRKKGRERERVIRVLVNGQDFTPYISPCSKDFRSYCNLMLLQELKIYNYDLACGK